MMFLSRMAIENSRGIRLGDIRNAQVSDVIDPDSSQLVRIYGVHLDDRNEKNRLRQVEELIFLINASDLPTVVMGDFNAMYRESMQARILRNEAILEVIKNWPHARSKDILHRLVSTMAACIERVVLSAYIMTEPSS